MKAIFGEKGFTLIEMLLVLTLIAAIVGVALPSFRSMQHEGNMTRAKGDLRTLQTAVESYYIHHTPNEYPESLDDLVDEDTHPKVVTTLPKDPFDPGEDYSYDIEDNYYIIYSAGPSGESEPSVDEDGVVAEDSDVWVSNMHLAEEAEE